MVWTAQNYHDVTNIKDVDMLAFDKAVYDALKPGGVFVVLDHAAAPGAQVTNTLHRIDPAVVRKQVEAAGFKFDGESKLLVNAADDHSALGEGVRPGDPRRDRPVRLQVPEAKISG